MKPRPQPRGVTPKGPTDVACACATARRLARVLTQLYDSRLRDRGIEAAQFALMASIARQGPSSQVALGQRYALDKTTVSRNLKVLARKGWIESSTANDRRERHFTLTAAGRRRLAAARPGWKKAQAALRSAMTARQWDAMFEVFTTVTEAARSIPGSANRRAKQRWSWEDSL